MHLMDDHNFLAMDNCRRSASVLLHHLVAFKSNMTNLHDDLTLSYSGEIIISLHKCPKKVALVSLWMCVRREQGNVEVGMQAMRECHPTYTNVV